MSIKETVVVDGTGNHFHTLCLEPEDKASGAYTGIKEADIPADINCEECGGPLTAAALVPSADVEDDDTDDDEDDDEDDD